MATLPLPELRSHLTVTCPNGFNGVCDRHGAVSWVNEMSLGDRCAMEGCGQVLTWKLAPSRVRTGYVVKVDTAVSGRALVYLNPLKRGRKLNEVVVWERVTDVTVRPV